MNDTSGTEAVKGCGTFLENYVRIVSKQRRNRTCQSVNDDIAAIAASAGIAREEIRNDVHQRRSVEAPVKPDRKGSNLVPGFTSTAISIFNHTGLLQNICAIF